MKVKAESEKVGLKLSIQKLFCGIYSAFKCSFDEFVGEKVFSPSYSSTILAPPPKKPLDESERGEWKSWLKAQHSENKDHGIWSQCLWEIDGETVETVTDFILGGSKITADGDCSHEIKRCLLLGSKAMTNLDSILKSRDYFADKGSSSQSYVFFSSMETSIQSCMDVRVGL